ALKSTEVALLGPVLGWLVDRFGAQGIIRAGIITFGIGFMLLSRIETLTGFYAAFVVIALGASMFSNFLASVVIIQWFEKRRARALSALQFGGAIGGLFVFLVAWSIQGFRLAGDHFQRRRHRYPGRLAARARDPQPPGGSRRNRGRHAAR